MFFTYKKSRFCVNCDWLQFSVHTAQTPPEILCPDGYRLEICQGNNIFENRAIVYDQRGAKFLTILWGPYSKVLPANLMTCQVSNEYLYLPAGMGFKWAWQVLSEMVECSFNAIGRVDICIDWEGTNERTEFLKHLNSGHYYAQRKSEGSAWWHEIKANGHSRKQIHCLTWGSQKSEIKVKIYHKSREQGILNGDEPEKPWIIEEWKQAGMNVQNVWRLEFSLCGAGQLRYKGEPIKLENVADPNWLLSVLCECYDARFVTRINQGRREGHKNNDERVYLFELPNTAKGLKWAEPKGKDYDLPAAITLLRSMMRQIDNPVIMAHRPTFETYATAILDIVRDHRLDGYFLRTYEQNAEDYFNTLSAEVGQGVRHCVLSPSRLMD